MRVHRWLQVFVILHLCNLLLCARHRPRGVGLIKLPFGVSDHRSGPYLPNLYIAGNKLYHKTQTVPDVSLPGQNKDFTGNVQFNPFTHMLGVTFNHDYGDSWGSGYALHGVNFHNLPLGKNFKDFASLPTLSTDGLYQPFSNSFIVGAEFDDLKFRSQAVALDIPIPALNENSFRSSILKWKRSKNATKRALTSSTRGSTSRSQEPTLASPSKCTFSSGQTIPR
ncbi:hypothetical protein L596_008816 [Steinernema carpocapsae]|uniref:Uncharacterized protein n=1 Tax=Steinernema carpocapsae TaxID=34508 RepID=A0A4U5PDW5_STECR|nr:hypothetical protein L596_008816 [Steinernema carpocapsae]